ncbi:hypothetical protein [Rickettsia asembonensis]|nr:hypothetical protein [Rickettsia asembonensis]
MSFPRGIVAWTGKTHCVTPWLDHGVHKNNKQILILTGYRGQATV